MAERSPFGMRLWRLLRRRGPRLQTTGVMAAAFARQAGVPYSELDAVIKGAEPSQQTVRQLAPALAMHAADLFVIAGLPVPDDLAPAGPTSPWDVQVIIRRAAKMTQGQRRRFDELIQSLCRWSPGPIPCRSMTIRRGPEP